MTIVLGIDLGTKCGWALSSDGVIASGCWHLTPGKQDTDCTRWLRMFRKLEEVIELYGKPDLVAFEQVASHSRGDTKIVECPHCHLEHEIKIQASNTMAAHAFGGFRTVLELWCDFHSLRVCSVHVPTLKKFATGNGRADKSEMIATAQLRWRDQNVIDDNQADALHVLDWAITEVLRKNRRRTSKTPELFDADDDEKG